jgi:hypothetical protein
MHLLLVLGARSSKVLAVVSVGPPNPRLYLTPRVGCTVCTVVICKCSWLHRTNFKVYFAAQPLDSVVKTTPSLEALSESRFAGRVEGVSRIR